MHPGATRMEESVRRSFTWKKCCDDIRDFVKTCKICQKTKSTNKQKKGKIPLKDFLEYNAFDDLSVDLCGPWLIQARLETEREYKVRKGKEKGQIKKVIEKRD